MDNEVEAVKDAEAEADAEPVKDAEAEADAEPVKDAEAEADAEPVNDAEAEAEPVSDAEAEATGVEVKEADTTTKTYKPTTPADDPSHDLAGVFRTSKDDETDRPAIVQHPKKRQAGESVGDHAYATAEQLVGLTHTVAPVADTEDEDAIAVALERLDHATAVS